VGGTDAVVDISAVADQISKVMVNGKSSKAKKKEIKAIAKNALGHEVAHNLNLDHTPDDSDPRRLMNEDLTHDPSPTISPDEAKLIKERVK